LDLAHSANQKKPNPMSKITKNAIIVKSDPQTRNTRAVFTRPAYPIPARILGVLGGSRVRKSKPAQCGAGLKNRQYPPRPDPCTALSNPGNVGRHNHSLLGPSVSAGGLHGLVHAPSHLRLGNGSDTICNISPQMTHNIVHFWLP
jgi:hypothetical protein